MIRNALFLCVVCALVFVSYLPSYVKMQDMNEKNHAYEKRISDLERDNVRLQEERRRLTDDPAYFEKVAREKMGIIRDGEVVYKILGPGQKKNGVVSEESSFIIKPAVDDADDGPKAAVKPGAGVKTAVKPAVTLAVNAKPAGTKFLLKKNARAAARKIVSTTVKKKSNVFALKKTTVSTKEKKLLP